MTRIRLLVPVLVCGVIVAACGGGQSSGPGTGGTVTIDNESGGPWSCVFSPFDGSVNFLSLGIIYEPLVFQNVLKDGATTPWLASAYSWNSDNTQLTFTIRSGVKWSDGQPFSADDVAFTFNLLKQKPALDLNGVWSVLSSVTKSGSDKVVFAFSQPAVPYFWFIADQIGIVPQHIWSSISAPDQDAIMSPVGTGPFKMNKCTAQNIEYTRNTSYWQAGLPKLDKVEYPAFLTNDAANTYLSNGQAQWGAQYIPNIQHVYANKPNRHYWFPPVGNVTIFPNLGAPGPQQNVLVRQALSLAIDRNKASQIGESGYEPPANQFGVVTPTFKSWVDSSLTSTYNYSYNPNKAVSLLEQAGYTRSADGTMVGPDGHQLSLSIIVNNGYSDWIASLQVIKQNLADIGIALTINPENNPTPFSDDLFKGNFQLAYYEEPTFGPTPYYEMYEWLDSAVTAPEGQNASFNYERWQDSGTDSLFSQYTSTSPSDTGKLHSIVSQLQKIMLTQVPVIPVTEGVDWYQYDTTHLGGWITQDNPYAQPAAFIYPDWEVQLIHLYRQ